MEREIIVTEYQQLRDYLNRANKLSNQKSKLTFKIEQANIFNYYLFAVIESTLETHRLTLAERTRMRTWERTGYSPFKNLEEFCAKTLNEIEWPLVPKLIYISPQKMESLQNQINLKFSSLLLNQSYEP